MSQTASTAHGNPNISKILQRHDSRQKNPRPGQDDHTPLQRKQLDAPRKKSPGECLCRPRADNPHSRRYPRTPRRRGSPTYMLRTRRESARRGSQQLQEIFMVDEPLDGRRAALLVRQFPGVTGALILLEGGAVLGGQLPDWLNLEAALQAPEVLHILSGLSSNLNQGKRHNQDLLPSPRQRRSPSYIAGRLFFWSPTVAGSYYQDCNSD